MDLIYTDSNRQDINVLNKYSLDVEIATETDKCTFEIDTIIDMELINNAEFWYIEGTEYGGIIDSKKITTSKKTAALGGRSWRGILGSKIIEPDNGQAYYTVTGELNQCISTVLSRIGLTSLFRALNTSTNKTITYQFDRYTDAYKGLLKMLGSVGYKMQLRWENKKVTISAIPIVDYSNERELTSDLFDFVITKKQNFVNHMIGLGSGELTERMVVHKYLQEDGTVGDTQFYFGDEEVASIYDYSNVESLDELTTKTAEELEKKIASSDTLKITANNLEADVMDIFEANDIYTGISIKEYITNKIVQLEDGQTKISYKVGNVK